MTQVKTLKRVKSEREYVRGIIKTGTITLVTVLLFSWFVTWLATFDHEPWLRMRAFTVATVLPAITVPVCIGIIGYQNLRDHRYMLDINQLAHTDEMTGLANRRAFMSEAHHRVQSSSLATRGLCAFIIDLDHFKTVNDRYGHTAGDETLIQVAKLMESSLPEDATMARLGGEEFAVLMAFESMADIHDHAERLRSSVASNPCWFEGEQIFVTVSVGIGIASKDDTIRSLLSRADCALYEAKHDGRNRFMIAA